jgi:hypothetical protein
MGVNLIPMGVNSIPMGVNPNPMGVFRLPKLNQHKNSRARPAVHFIN